VGGWINEILPLSRLDAMGFTYFTKGKSKAKQSKDKNSLDGVKRFDW
jgi:hypothetical protein